MLTGIVLLNRAMKNKYLFIAIVIVIILIILRIMSFDSYQRTKNYIEVFDEQGNRVNTITYQISYMTDKAENDNLIESFVRNNTSGFDVKPRKLIVINYSSSGSGGEANISIYEPIWGIRDITTDVSNLTENILDDLPAEVVQNKECISEDYSGCYTVRYTLNNYTILSHRHFTII